MREYATLNEAPTFQGEEAGLDVNGNHCFPLGSWLRRLRDRGFPVLAAAGVQAYTGVPAGSGAALPGPECASDAPASPAVPATAALGGQLLFYCPVLPAHHCSAQLHLPFAGRRPPGRLREGVRHEGPCVPSRTLMLLLSGKVYIYVHCKLSECGSQVLRVVSKRLSHACLLALLHWFPFFLSLFYLRTIDIYGYTFERLII